MCGIAGVISWDDKYRVTRETLQRMSARIAHRGPDGEGFYLNHEQEVTPEHPQCGFAFRRLAILDPDPRAMQPFTVGDKTIVFNGEIYNFRELRAELTNLRPEYQWRTTGDTEVLLLAYEAWGRDCVMRLNGMYALAVWDQATKALFLARDRMGQKPLYVAYLNRDGNPAGPSLEHYQAPSDPAVIVFASELAAVRASCFVHTPFDTASLNEYLQLGYLPQQRTIWDGVRHLRPAARVEATATSCGESWYWPAEHWNNQSPRAVGDDVAVRRTRELLTSAVRRQLVADVPLGCFLSGGVDSSVVAAAMKSAVAAGQEVLTFSIGFDDPRYDESEYARQVARHLGTRHHSFTVRPDVISDLPKLAAVFGEPFADSSAIPTHYLARETRNVVKVALSGDGGDELFGGYDRYRAMAIAQRLQRVAGGRLPWLLLSPLLRLIPGTHPKSRATRLRRLLAGVGLEPGNRYASYVRLFDGDTIVALTGHHIADWKSWGPTHNDRLYFQWGDPTLSWSGSPSDRLSDDVRAALALDRITYLPGDLLTKVDRASMLHGLEVRSPFMDHELVEFAAGLTTDQLLKGGPKWMLREAFADDLPAWVFKRKKMGFAVPIGEWFRGELRAMLRDNLFAADSFARQQFNMKVVERLVEEHEREKVDHSQRLYALLMLELWWRTTR
jgi:asparagine synthase (glutamine-hydrolysing)